MERFLETLRTVWQVHVPLAPTLLALAIVLAVDVARRKFKWAYLPIYLMFAPTNHIDKRFAEYYGDDYYFPDPASLTPAKVRNLAARIRVATSVAFIVSAAVVPLFTGFIIGLFYPPPSYIGLVVVIFVVKVFRIWTSLVENPWIPIATGRSHKALIAIYVVYLACFFAVFDFSYSQGKYVLANGVSYDLLANLFARWQAIVFLVIGWIVVAVLTAYLVDPNLREDHIAAYQAEGEDEDTPQDQ